MAEPRRTRRNPASARRARVASPAPTPVVARVVAIVVSYNVRDHLGRALASLAVLPDVATVVVDNASADGSADFVAAEFPSVRLVRSATNAGFAAAVNRGARASSGDYLLILNPDAELRERALERLVSFMDSHPRAAVAGPSLVYGDGRPQQSAFRFPGLAQLALDLFPVPRLKESRLNGRYPRSGQPTRVDHPLGACMLVRRTAWDDVGPLDEGYFMYVEEVDWCRRARRRGWSAWQVPDAVVVHHGGQSTRQHATAMFVQLWRSRLRYYERHESPFYNRVVRLVVRIGMSAEERRARRTYAGRLLSERLEAIREVRALAR